MRPGPLTLLHLTGSATSRFFADLSRTYADDCLEVLGADPGLIHHVAEVSPDGRWRVDRSAPLPVADALGRIARLGIDVVVPQMFCLPGMTSYRAVFDVLGIPVVGNPPEVMALAAHKARARAVVAAAGVDVPRGEVLGPGEEPTLPPPAVVKPVDADNSSGVTLVSAPDGWAAALAGAFEHASTVLVEEYVPLGREVRCGIVERDGGLQCLPLEEYAVSSVRTPDDKLSRAGDGIALMAKSADRAWILPTDDPVTPAVWDLARRCHTALGCRDYSLIDVRVDPSGRPWFLEAGPYCSFARGSVIATMAAAAGIGTGALFTELATRACARHGLR